MLPRTLSRRSPRLQPGQRTPQRLHGPSLDRDPEALGRGARRLLKRADGCVLGSVRADGAPELLTLYGPPGFLGVVAPRRLLIPSSADTRRLAAASLRGNVTIALSIVDHAQGRRLELSARIVPVAGATRDSPLLVEIDSHAWVCMADATRRYSLEELDELDELLPIA